MLKDGSDGLDQKPWACQVSRAFHVTSYLRHGIIQHPMRQRFDTSYARITSSITNQETNFLRLPLSRS
jgi:hypothetical protein